MNQFHVVYGPPGCGKTTNMAKRARAFADEYGGDSVLIASLTRAAAAEIRSRDTGVPRQNVGTLHSLCLAELGRPPIAEVEVKKWNDENPNWRITPTRDEDEKQTDYIPMGMFEITGDDLISECGLLRAQMIPIDHWEKASPLGSHLMNFWHRWCEWKDDCGFLDFTDLIEHAVDKVKLPPRGARILLFDEAQDYSRLEFKLCMQWGEYADHVRFTGDPDQNLYEWRGADPRVFMGNDIANKSILSQSYRVPQAVRDTATEWIRQIDERDDVIYKPTDQPGSVERAWSTWMNPMDDLCEMIPHAEQTGEDLMVLTACNYMLAPTVSELRRRGIRFHNPFRKRHGGWNPLRIGGKKLSAADRLVRFMSVGIETDPATIRDWLEPLSADILSPGAKPRAKNLEVGLDLGALRDLFLSESDFMRAMSADVEWYRDHVVPSRRKPFFYPAQVVLNYAPGVVGTAQRVKALTDKPNLIVGTCHSVKGGEADNVMLYPNISWAASRQMKEDADSIIRQFYVGMTRAKKALYLGEAARGFKHHAVEWL